MQHYSDIWSKRPAYLPFKDMQTLLACYFTTIFGVDQTTISIALFSWTLKKINRYCKFWSFHHQQLHLRWQDFYSHNNNIRIKIAVSIKMHLMFRVGGYILLHYPRIRFRWKYNLFQNTASSNTYDCCYCCYKLKSKNKWKINDLFLQFLDETIR